MTATGKSRANKTTRKARVAKGAAPKQPSTVGKTSKLGLIVTLLRRPEGASLAELVAATDWQAHSVRGALAGALKKKGHAVLSEKHDGLRRYRIEADGATRG